MKVNKIDSKDENAGKFFGNKTTGWGEQEYIKINGRKLVYSVSNNVITVRFPGGASAMIVELRSAGKHIQMPQIIRKT